MSDVKLFQDDCLDVMPTLEAASIDMVLCDLPYGVTACAWDAVIPFEPLWAQYRRITKERTPIILTATQPFTSALVMSNPKLFKYGMVWDKGRGSNPLLAKKQPMRSHEDILVFYRKSPVYHPQMTDGVPYKSPRTGGNRTNRIVGATKDKVGWKQDTKDTSKRFPTSIIKASIHCGSKLLPTQKPVSLMEYLIKTYSNPGDVVLDNTMGSGTTGIACVNLGRSFIGIEKDLETFRMAQERIAYVQDKAEVTVEEELNQEVDEAHEGIAAPD